MRDLPLLVLLLAIGFLLLWLLQRHTNNASWADAGWALAVGLVMLWWLASGQGDTGCRWLVGAVVGFWSARLILHLWHRAWSSTEDGRFQALRREWGARAQRNFLRYFLLQVPLVLVFALPAAALAQDGRPLAARDIVAVLAWVTPVAAYFFLTRITGIPPAERRALVRRGDDYRRYQAQTSLFFPRSPKVRKRT